MKKKEFTWALVKTVILLLAAVLFLFPLIWMVSASLKPNSEIFTQQFHFFGSEIRWHNYVEVWTHEHASMLRAYLNTLKIVVISTAGQLAIASLAAYAFAKVHFKGKNIVFMLFLASMMIPTQVTIIPRFMVFKTLGLYNTHWSIILPTLFGATSIFMLRQFYMGLPDSLMEAAKIDGAGHMRIFLQVMMPLTKPAMVTLLVLTFVSSWNEYLSPLVFLIKEELYTVSQAIRYHMLDAAGGARDDLTMAASVSAILPVVILFIFTQKYFVEGIATSGVKG